MAKRRKKQQRKTNWLVIGAIVVGSILLLIGLTALAFQEPAQLDLGKYCQNNPENCVARGPADAAVTMVEVSDYGCPHCKNYNLDTAPILDAAYEGAPVRWVVLPFALPGQTGDYPTMATAVASLCANEQGAFWQFHPAAFKLMDTPALFNTREGWLLTAESLGLDMEAFSSCLDNNNYEDVIRANINAAQNAGISATPSFSINGEILRGNQPVDVFMQRIDSFLN
ncbi:MAG: thioredoxin domain-containing protein [Chloroflexi bacterium]|nr:thioredoxin domain-containing protein [Chloroflexota bacterium]